MVFYSSSLYTFPLATPPEPSSPLSASSSPPPSGDSGKLWLLCALGGLGLWVGGGGGGGGGGGCVGC